LTALSGRPATACLPPQFDEEKALRKTTASTSRAKSKGKQTVGAAERHQDEAATTDRRRQTGQETKKRITEAAERLFALNGYEAVGLREIIREAGVHSAAVYYHFGSKEALLFHILHSHAEPIAAKRMVYLEKLRKKGPLVLEEVLDAFLRPAVHEERAGRPVRSTYADIRLGLSINHQAAVRAIQAEVFDASSHAFLKAFKECLPHLSERDIYFRFDFLLGLMIHAMANNGRVTELSLGQADPTHPDEVLQHMIPFIAAGMRSAPVSK